MQYIAYMQCSAIRAKLPHSENSLHYFSVDSIAVPVFAVWLNLTNTVSEWIRSLIYFSENYFLQKSAVFVQFIKLKPKGTAQRKFIALVQVCMVEHRTCCSRRSVQSSSVKSVHCARATGAKIKDKCASWLLCNAAFREQCKSEHCRATLCKTLPWASISLLCLHEII